MKTCSLTACKIFDEQSMNRSCIFMNRSCIFMNRSCIFMNRSCIFMNVHEQTMKVHDFTNKFRQGYTIILQCVALIFLQVNGTAVGFMSISTSVNVQVLSEYFDLSPFNELRKQPSLISSNTSGNFDFVLECPDRILQSFCQLVCLLACTSQLYLCFRWTKCVLH